AHDLEHLGWGRLALDLYSDQPEVASFLPRLDERIRKATAERRGVPWVQPSSLRTALVALALRCQHTNPFRLQPVTSSTPVDGRDPAPSKKPLGERVRSAFRGVIIRGLDRFRQPPAVTQVHVAPVSDYNADLVDVLRRQFEHFRAEVPIAGKRVVLKPNLV